MKEYVKIEVKTLEKLSRRDARKTAYIKKLKAALRSVKRQVENSRKVNNAET